MLSLCRDFTLPDNRQAQRPVRSRGELVNKLGDLRQCRGLKPAGAVARSGGARAVLAQCSAALVGLDT